MTATEAKSLLSIATRKMRRGALADASSTLAAALELDPANAEAWFLMAEIHRHEDRTSAAIGCYARGLQVAPGRVDLTIGLANACSDAGRFDDAAAAFERLIATDPGNADYLYGCAHALHRANRTEAALVMLDKAIAIRPDAPLQRFSRATMLLTLGRYSEGWPEYDTRLAADLNFHPPDLPCWDGTPAPQKRLLVMPEGGYGDIIWAARFLPAIRSMFDSVHVMLPPALRAVMSGLGAIDGIHVEGGLADAKPRSHDAFDLYCPILSLPARLNVTDPSAYPPARLTASAQDDRLAGLLARAGEKLRVGIIWSGNETYSENRHRAASLAAFLPLIERPDVQLFSLQKGRQQAVLREAGPGDLIIDTDDFDFTETAALVQALDLVIMTDSAVAHVAGSLGGPVWVLLDAAPFWLFGRRGDCTPWYPGMRLFRQSSPGDWPGVMAEVQTALDAFDRGSP
ncbi:MAG: tetratricopeptide repeat-containing glycosyltransferase family protein [Rhodobacter sp.]|nr:tetratricopeptide repeat-containing glycosyltransferase family protein [Rhodobacter sp.]